MSEQPTGTVTFLFTDIEGSTRLWQDHPEAMRAVLARHDELVRDAIESRGGYVVKTTGDGFHAAFPDPVAAINAAIGAQQALSAEAWTCTEQLRVRMGLHAGSVESREGDYHGTAVNKAARLMGIAHGGQIVVSRAVVELVDDELPRGVALADLGEHRLRDLTRAERVFQVRAPGLAAEFPALTSVDAFPGNLPLQVSSFIGRERETGRTLAALGEARVVTLTGVGGVGKTRLALQVAAEALPTFREGAWLVELAPVRDPDGVVDAFASVFGLTSRAGQSLLDVLLEFLRTKQLLLVADNCEHLLDAVADVVDAIGHTCSGVVILATSREGLALDGEQILAVPTLAAPDTTDDWTEVGASDAVQLFVERARAADAEFVLSADNAAIVGQVCRRLDGVPLAIELAAARIPAMSPYELVAALDRRFEVLAGGRRRAVKRQQTLHATIDWSYELLSAAEQRLLARLAVFAGGCTRSAIEVACGGDPIPAGRAFELLGNLVSRSLVVAERDRFETRYRLLETIREYGEERLTEHHETETMRARHADYYAEFARIVSEECQGPRQAEAVRRLAPERENLLAAMNHAIDSDDTDLAFGILRSLPPPGFLALNELRLQVEPTLALPDAPEHPLFPFGAAVAAEQAARLGDRDSTVARCDEALAAKKRLRADPDNDVDWIVCIARANLAAAEGQFGEAAAYTERAVEFNRAAGRPAQVAIFLGGAASYHAFLGETEAAVRLATEGLGVARAIDMRRALAMNTATLAGALADQEPQRARELLEESLQYSDDLDDEEFLLGTHAVLISARLHDWPRALHLAAHTIPQLHWARQEPFLSAVFNVVARGLCSSAPEAASVIQGAARRFRLARNPRPEGATSADERTSLVKDLGAKGSPRLGGFLADLRVETKQFLDEALGEPRHRELVARGEAMNTDDAVAFALSAIESTRQT
jgi:predicted ATPase/class 3 adenylate cyclase